MNDRSRADLRLYSSMPVGNHFESTQVSETMRPVNGGKGRFNQGVDAMVANGASPVIKFESLTQTFTAPSPSVQYNGSGPTFKTESPQASPAADSVARGGVPQYIPAATEHSFHALYGAQLLSINFKIARGFTYLQVSDLTKLAPTQERRCRCPATDMA